MTTPITKTPANKDKSSVPATPEQKRLFDMLAKFAIQRTVQVLEYAYRDYTKEIMQSDTLKLILPHFFNEYFNECAFLLYSGTDRELCEFFDEMLSICIPLAGKNTKYEIIDLLNQIVRLVMHAITHMNIKTMITADSAETMKNIRAHITTLINKKSDWAAKLCGCDCGVVHVPVKKGEAVFNLSFQKAIMTNNNTVEIEDDWFEEI